LPRATAATAVSSNAALSARTMDGPPQPEIRIWLLIWRAGPAFGSCLFQPFFGRQFLAAGLVIIVIIIALLVGTLHCG